MGDDDFGRGVQMGGVVNAIETLKSEVVALNSKVDQMQQTLATLTGGHRAVLWVFSAVGAGAALLATLYSGALNKLHH